MNLSKRIKKILFEQNLKQKELASALGVSGNYISLLVNGKKTNVSLTLAKLIESLYGYSANWVLTGDFSENMDDIRNAAIEKIMEMNTDELLRLKKFIDGK